MGASTSNVLPITDLNGAPMNGAPMNGAPMAPMNGTPMNGMKPMNGTPMDGSMAGVSTTADVRPSVSRDERYSLLGAKMGFINAMLGTLILAALLTGTNFADYLGANGGRARIVIVVGILAVLFLVNQLGINQLT